MASNSTNRCGACFSVLIGGLQLVNQGRENSMGTPALSREKSDLARRSVAMITKDAVGSPKVPQLQTLGNFSGGQICFSEGSWTCCIRWLHLPRTLFSYPWRLRRLCIDRSVTYSPLHSHLYWKLLFLFYVIILSCQIFVQLTCLCIGVVINKFKHCKLTILWSRIAVCELTFFCFCSHLFVSFSGWSYVKI